jgi:hypothetical protein
MKTEKTRMHKPTYVSHMSNRCYELDFKRDHGVTVVCNVTYKPPTGVERPSPLYIYTHVHCPGSKDHLVIKKLINTI